MNLSTQDSTTIEEGPLRRLFFRILQALSKEPILAANFLFKEIEFSVNETKQVLHGLNTIPYDIIMTSKIGNGTITFNYSSFTSSILSITCSGLASGEKCTVRFLYGRFKE